MAITSLSATVTASLANSRTKAQSGVDAASQAFQKADERVQRQRDLVSAELSALGKLKSSFSETQAASRALSDSKQTTADTGITKAASNFVKSFNTATQAAKSAIASHATLADSSRARAAESDLRRAISAEATTASDLKAIGITQQKDGALAIDAKKFDAALKADPDALRSTLSKAGQQVDRVVTGELADRGNIGLSVNSLGNRARNLESQQADQQAQAAAAQQAVSAQTTRLNNSLVAGAAAYQRIFSI